MKKIHAIAFMLVTLVTTLILSDLKGTSHRANDLISTKAVQIAEAKKPPSDNTPEARVDAAKVMTTQEAAQAAPKVEDEHVAVDTPKTSQAAPAAPTIACGSQDPKLVYDILRDIGVPPVAAIQQVGSWMHESDLDPCQKEGDGGVAWGLNSWHPGRRADMPAGLREQITWAIKVEMPRDCRSCYDQFMAASSVSSVRSAIKKSTRWGIEGRRWMYADQVSSLLQ